MNIIYEDEKGKLYNGEALEVLHTMPDNSIDSVITDPPYGLSDNNEKVIREVMLKWLSGEDDYVPKKKGFMGKAWDGFVPPPALWREVYRVMKPGATALVFSGTRTYDLMTMSLRLAGFEIKDTLMWLYASGFPKGQDISKMIDKKLGAEREVAGYSDSGLHHKCNVTNFKNWKQDNESLCPITNPTTPEAKQWEGHKTHSLKPAYEPIIMAIKPNDGTYADNAMKWGVSGLNVNDTRIGNEEISVHDAPKGTFAGGELGRGSIKNYKTNNGRFPANVLLDEEAAKMLDEQSGRLKSGGTGMQYKRNEYNASSYMIGNIHRTNIPPSEGGASRFFYVAKASKTERGENNAHPTVKPIKLIEYLVKLLSMPSKDQVYLDTFIGSGTLALACKHLNKKWIGIELNEEYAMIAAERIKNDKGSIEEKVYVDSIEEYL